MREIKKSGFEEYMKIIKKQKLEDNPKPKLNNRKNLRDHKALLAAFILELLIISILGFLGIFHIYETKRNVTHTVAWGDILNGYNGNVGDKTDYIATDYWQASEYPVFWILFGCYFLLFLALIILFLMRCESLKLYNSKVKKILLVWCGLMFLICIGMEVSQFLLGSHTIFGFGTLMIIPIPICAIFQFVSLDMDD